MKLEGIDKGNSFDWGKTSRDYAKYRDIYPVEFCITTRNFGGSPQFLEGRQP